MHIQRGESEYLYQTQTKWHTCLSVASIISTNLSEALRHLRPTHYAKVLALRTRGRKPGQGAIKNPLLKSEVKAGDDLASGSGPAITSACF